MSANVKIVRRVLTTLGRRFCPVVIAANGRVSPDRVLVAGEEKRYADGTFYLEWWDGPTRKRLSVGKDASSAQAQRMRKEAQLHARANGLELKEDNSSGPRRLVSDAISDYLKDIRINKKPKTISAYTKALGYFQESCTKDRVDEIDRRDMLTFASFLKDKKKLSPRTVANKFANVNTFLRAEGIRELLKKGDRPRYVEEEPECFEREDIDALFSSCTRNERLLFDFFLMTGMREQEVIYVSWPDINFKGFTVSVRWKEQYNWTPKGYKGRVIPVPTKLIDALEEAKRSARKDCQLIFPTSEGKPKLDFLDVLKSLAVRAAVNPETVWLHKFRATFATWHLWAGVDLRTVQLWMGHTEIESTMRYLKPNRGQAVRDKVNLTFG